MSVDYPCHDGSIFFQVGKGSVRDVVIFSDTRSEALKYHKTSVVRVYA